MINKNGEIITHDDFNIQTIEAISKIERKLTYRCYQNMNIKSNLQ